MSERNYESLRALLRAGLMAFLVHNLMMGRLRAHLELFMLVQIQLVTILIAI